VIGERILAAAPALARIAPIVRASHERPDGEGYPDGLTADSIPIGARIIAVVDAFDAMVSPRPYRAAKSVAQGVAELHRCAGTQFDATVVAAFVYVIESLQLELRAA
jgi:HD-GYP domain-containing protein (c-di-GMP phosphodiesterase class II)